MEYRLDINGTDIVATLTPGKENRAGAAVGEKDYAFEYHRISGTCIQLRVNGRQVKAWVTPEKDGKTVLLNGRHYRVRDKALQARTGRSASAGTGREPSAVTPPMPAIVIQVPVSEGDRVEKGDAVVIVSAMKMETSLRAPYGGIITRIGVSEGDKVMPGDILADIEGRSDGEAV